MTSPRPLFFIAVFDFILICRQTAHKVKFGSVGIEKQVKNTSKGSVTFSACYRYRPPDFLKTKKKKLCRKYLGKKVMKRFYRKDVGGAVQGPYLWHLTINW